MHLHVLARTDSGVHTFRQRAETTFYYCYYYSSSRANWMGAAHTAQDKHHWPQRNIPCNYTNIYMALEYAEQVVRPRPFIYAWWQMRTSWLTWKRFSSSFWLIKYGFYGVVISSEQKILRFLIQDLPSYGFFWGSTKERIIYLKITSAFYHHIYLFQHSLIELLYISHYINLFFYLKPLIF